MSAEAREKAREHGQRSGKGSRIVSRLWAKLTGSENENDQD